MENNWLFVHDFMWLKCDETQIYLFIHNYLGTLL